MNDEFSFSEWLENTLKENNLTAYSMAEKVGHSPFCIYHYVNCKRSPTINTVNDFLNAFGKKLIVVDKEKTDE